MRNADLLPSFTLTCISDIVGLIWYRYVIQAHGDSAPGRALCARRFEGKQQRKSKA